MTKLAGFLGRRRRWVVAGLGRDRRPRAAVRLAPDRSPDRRRLRRPRQPVEGGQRLARRATSARSADGIAVLLQAEPGATPAAARRRRRRGSPRRRRARRGDAPARGRAPRRGAAAAHRHRDAAAAQRPVLRPADRLGDDPAHRPRPRHRRRPGHHLPRRPADDLGRHAGALEGRPRQSRGGWLPDRRADPARRLRLARRSGAAAGARLRQRDRHRRADLLHLAEHGDLGLRHQHGLDDRDRGRDRLLALHPRPLPRGAAGRPQRGGRARARRWRPRGWRSPSPASP